MTTTESTPTGTRTGSVLRHTVKKERPAAVARTAPRRNAAGRALGTVDLEPTVFGLEPNRALLHQVVTAQLAAVRAGTQSTLTRAEVRGGGAKPYRQKGTGRARQGSTRSPSMSGGGVALGPKPRSYAQRTPKKMVRLALLSALSDRADVGRIVVVDEWGIGEPDTRAAVILLRKCKLNGTVLVVLAQDEIDVALSFRNIPEASTTTWAELSAHDVLRADWLVFTDRTLPTATSDFAGTHEERAALAAAGGPEVTTSTMDESESESESEAEEAEAQAPEPSEDKPKRRIRRTKAAVETEPEAAEADAAEVDADAATDTDAMAATADEAGTEETDADA
jgi:large subunit ribosomal protein L4